MRQLEDIIEEGNATMAMDSLPLTDDDKDRIRRMGSSREEMEKSLQSCLRSIL